MKWNGTECKDAFCKYVSCSSGIKGLVTRYLKLKGSNCGSLTSFYNYVVIIAHKL